MTSFHMIGWLTCPGKISGDLISYDMLTDLPWKDQWWHHFVDLSKFGRRRFVVSRYAGQRVRGKGLETNTTITFPGVWFVGTIWGNLSTGKYKILNNVHKMFAVFEVSSLYICVYDSTLHRMHDGLICVWLLLLLHVALCACTGVTDLYRFVQICIDLYRCVQMWYRFV